MCVSPRSVGSDSIPADEPTRRHRLDRDPERRI
jgi:hypothetical protein